MAKKVKVIEGAQGRPKVEIEKDDPPKSKPDWQKPTLRENKTNREMILEAYGPELGAEVMKRHSQEYLDTPFDVYPNINLGSDYAGLTIKSHEVTDRNIFDRFQPPAIILNEGLANATPDYEYSVYQHEAEHAGSISAEDREKFETQELHKALISQYDDMQVRQLIEKGLGIPVEEILRRGEQDLSMKTKPIPLDVFNPAELAAEWVGQMRKEGIAPRNDKEFEEFFNMMDEKHSWDNMEHGLIRIYLDLAKRKPAVKELLRKISLKKG